MEEKIIEQGMPFQFVKQLGAAQMRDLEALVERCRKADENVINYYPHILEQHRPFASSLLYYQGQQLEGFASLFFFYDAACELSVLVGPEFRRRGLAKQMVEALLPLMHNQHLGSVIVTSPAKTFSPLLKQKHFRYLHSEFLMERHAGHPVLLSQTQSRFRMAHMADAEAILEINRRCFPGQEDHLQFRLDSLLSDHNYDIMLLLREGRVLGKAHMRYHEQTATFSDIGILPEFQGKGLGTELLAHGINHCLKQGVKRMNLDVETENTNALNIYTRLGFEVVNACDYWQRDLPQIR